MKALIAAGLFALGISLPAAAHEPAPAQPTYAEDRAEIEDLMARYLFALDWNDVDAYVDTFTEDGELVFATGSARGHEEIRAIITRFKDVVAKIYRDEDGNPAKMRHVVAQTTIRVEGDRAFARALWLEMADTAPGEKPAIGSFGTYDDELERVDGHWLFKRREVFNELLEGRGSGDVNPVRLMDEKADAAASGEDE